MNKNKIITKKSAKKLFDRCMNFQRYKKNYKLTFLSTFYFFNPD